MKYIFITILLSVVTFPAIASTACSGKVHRILDWPAKCNGHLAFKIDSTGDVWLCALSDKGDSMVLTAYAADKNMSVRLELPTPDSCESATHYIIPLYMGMYD